jgi:hypothetical protein
MTTPNIVKTIFNAITGNPPPAPKSGAVPSTPPPAVSAGPPAPTTTAAPSPGGAGPSAADAWLARFNTPTYVSPNSRFILTPAFLLAVADASGEELISPTERMTVLAQEARHTAARAALSQCTEDSIRATVAEAFRQQEQQIQAGEPPIEIPDKARLQAQMALRRQQIRGEFRSADVLLRPVYGTVAARLAAAARTVATKLDDLERQQAAQFGLQFYPSHQLCAVIHLAIEGAAKLGGNFLINSCCSPSSAFVGAVLQFPTSDTPAGTK